MIFDLRNDQEKMNAKECILNNTFKKEIEIWQERPKLLSHSKVDTPKVSWNSSIHDLPHCILHIKVDKAYGMI